MRTTNRWLTIVVALGAALAFEACARPGRLFIIEEITSETVATAPLGHGPWKLRVTGEDASRLVGTLADGGGHVRQRNVSLAFMGCEGAEAGARIRRATARRLSGDDDAVELSIPMPDQPGCALVGRLELPGPASGGDAPPVLAGPDPGGDHAPPDRDPDQGFLAGPTLPDLVIREAMPLPGGAAQFEVTVANSGTGPSGATTITELYHRSRQVEMAEGPVPALAPGQEAVVEVGLNFPLAGADKIAFRVDEPNVVAEVNELNNGFIFE